MVEEGAINENRPYVVGADVGAVHLSALELVFIYDGSIFCFMTSEAPPRGCHALPPAQYSTHYRGL